MVLVPDLATDLGTPNDDFTEWTFTIRDDATWENGETITAEEVCLGPLPVDGLQRSSPPARAPSTPRHTSSARASTRAPTPATTPTARTGAASTVNGQDVTIKMAKPFPDMDCWGAFMAMGPAPLGKASDPPEYGQNILSNGPYKVESFRSERGARARQERPVEPDSDPARHQYADKFIFKFNADQTKVDQVMLSDNTAFADIASRPRQGRTTTSGSTPSSATAWFSRPRSAPASWRRTTTRSPTSTSARRSRRAYPYDDVWLASGEVPGVTRVPANSMMPPGMAGKHDYFADGEQFDVQPGQGQGAPGRGRLRARASTRSR